jgi:hypothetical protein
MFWSDSTQLASFGDASLWPLYMFMGNESKYRRCKPSQHLCSHVAYFKKVCALASTLDMCFYMVIKLPDAFKDFATHYTEGKGPNDAFYTHCRREAMQEQWRILLDNEFLDAYNQGIVILCVDGMERRFYPRIFTYSADYPEKCVFVDMIIIFIEDKLTVYKLYRILLTSIRNRGICPCPRCYTPLSQLHNLGTAQDRRQRVSLARLDNNQRRSKVTAARKLIYSSNYAVDSAAIQRLLKDKSWTPTIVCKYFIRSPDVTNLNSAQNAFSERLSPQAGFNLYRIFVVDLMHDFEIGGWRSLLIHLLRMLDSLPGGRLDELDRR